MKKIFMLIVTIFMCGCNKENSNSSQLEKIILEDNYVIVDVRTKEEFDESHIIGAINIPYNEINENIELDKNKTILVYCKSGNRSKIAFNNLNTLGYDTYDLGAFSEIDLPKE